jgi:predicted phage terminase large subunit-like protein
MNDQQAELRRELLSSFITFTKVFYKVRTGREFVISQPASRESHYITIAKELTKVFKLETRDLLINVPPGFGKSTLVTSFVAWAMAHYPDSNFLYISYSSEIATKHTYTIKQIMQLPLYKALFCVHLAGDSSAKDNFKTTLGGSVIAFGSAGSITGQDAGLPFLDRFSGAVIMDDMHKPDEVHSDVTREKVITNYEETILQRARGENVPKIFIGQRLREEDLPDYLKHGKDGNNWMSVILQAMDHAGNPLAPNLMSKEALLKKQKFQPYVYAAQYQQDPQPAGGGIFQKDWFICLPEEPKMLATFIVCDSAETNKTYNDATVFSFFGIYKIEVRNVDTDLYGLHWIDCHELWVEPKDLEDEFLQFWASCMRHPVKPQIAAIEKKSTGVTLLSTLKKTQGLRLIEIERSRDAGNKTTRFLAAQPFVSARRVTLPANAKHTAHCIEHMRKITANETHRYDDIADTLADGIQLALIDKVIRNNQEAEAKQTEVVAELASRFDKRQQMRREATSWPPR